VYFIQKGRKVVWTYAQSFHYFDGAKRRKFNQNISRSAQFSKLIAQKR